MWVIVSLKHEKEQKRERKRQRENTRDKDKKSGRVEGRNRITRRRIAVPRAEIEMEEVEKV